MKNNDNKQINKHKSIDPKKKKHIYKTWILPRSQFNSLPFYVFEQFISY